MSFTVLSTEQSMQANTECDPLDCRPVPTLAGRPNQASTKDHLIIEPTGSLTACHGIVPEAQETDGACSPMGDFMSAPSHGRPDLGANEGETENPGKVLKCPYFFQTRTKPCLTHHKFIRDVIRHLESHRRVFCPKCSNFGDADQKKQHICGKLRCIDFHCPNRQSRVQAHEKQPGCKFFNSLDTQRKWISLFAADFPGYPLPSWEMVCVVQKEASPNVPSNRASERLRAAISPSLDDVPHGHDWTEATVVVLPVVLIPGPHIERSSLNPSPGGIDTLDNVVYQQLVNQVLIGGSIRQNGIIKQHGEQHGHQRRLNEQHGREFQELREEVAHLRGTIRFLANPINVQQSDEDYTEKEAVTKESD